MHKSLCALLALLCLSTVATAAFAEPDALLSSGLQSYNEGNYQSASMAFNEATAAHPNNPTPHYLFAITLAKMNQPAAAQREYQAAIRLDPNGEIGKRARLGLKLQTAARASGSAGVSTGTIRSAADPNVIGAFDLIDHQADRAKQNKDASWTAYANGIRTSITAAVSSWRDRQNADVKAMTAARVYDRKGHSSPMYSESEIAAVQQQYENIINNLNSAADYTVNQATASAAQARAALDESVDSLRTQLANSKSAAVRLVPSATNLYIRTYAPVPSQSAAQPQQEELLADQERLILEPYPASKANRRSRSGTHSQLNAELNVQGRLAPRRGTGFGATGDPASGGSAR